MPTGTLGARVLQPFKHSTVFAFRKLFRIRQLPEASDFVAASSEVDTVREFAQAAFGTLGLDWRRHVQTDARLLCRTSSPLGGDSSKLRAATEWLASVSFVELVVRLMHEAKATPLGLAS